MSQLKKIGRILKTLVARPKALSNVLRNEILYESQSQNKYGIDRLPMVRLNEFLLDDVTSVKHAYLETDSMATDYLLLKSLAASIEECAYFEIGTWRGESALNVVEHTTSCCTLNLPLETLKKQHGDSRYADQIGVFSKTHPSFTDTFRLKEPMSPSQIFEVSIRSLPHSS